MEKSIEKNMMKLWIIRRSALVLVMLIATICACLLMMYAFEFIYLLIPVAFLDLVVLIYAYVFPKLQYDRYKYIINEKEIIVKSGVIFKSTFVIPLVQVQDISTTQTPFQILFKIKSVTLSTAGSNHLIVGINDSVAEEIIQDVKEKVNLYVKRDRGIGE